MSLDIAKAVHQLVPLHAVDSGKDSFILGPTPAQIKSGRAEMEAGGEQLPCAACSAEWIRRPSRVKGILRMIDEDFKMCVEKSTEGTSLQ